MIGLGVGIDYGLFIVTRHRDQLRAGMELRESIARTTATSGGAVLFAGGTVIIALLSLAVAGIPLVTTLGYTVGDRRPHRRDRRRPRCCRRSSACSAPRVNALPLPGHEARTTTSARTAGSAGPGSSPTTRGRRWSSGVVILLVLAAPLRHLHLGQTDIGALPDGHAVAPGLRRA